MTSLLPSTLNTIPENVSIVTANASSPASHPHTAILSKILLSWGDARLEEQNALETFNATSTANMGFGSLMAQLLHEQLIVGRTDRNSILSDLLSNVAQIVDVLMEDNKSDLCPSDLVEDLATNIGNGDTNTTLELMSCAILKAYLKPIMKHLMGSSTQTYITMPSSTIPTFQLGRLSLQSLFFDVRSAMISWVNQQFRNNIDYLYVDLILDFGPSWANGLAFTLLIYCLNPSYLSGELQHWIHQQLQHGDRVGNHDSHITDDNQANAVLSCAFDIAKHKMGMFACLTSQDMMGMVATANEWCIMLYVYEFYAYGSQQKQSPSVSLVYNLQQALESVHSVSHTQNAEDITRPLHPLDVIDESTISDYSQKVSMTVSLWNVYSSKTNVPSPHLLASVTTVRQAYDHFTRGLAFTHIGKEIQACLSMVEATMNDTDSSLTMDSVQQMEYQTDSAKLLLRDMKNQFGELVQQQRYRDYLEQLHQQVSLVCGWTSQLRKWMLKNDAIRERLRFWLDLIGERNIATNDLQCDAMTTTDPTALDYLDTTTLYYDHEKLKKDVEQFDATDDMQQLHDNIKQHTTASDEQQRYSAPVNMAMFGISLTTLDKFDHLWKFIMDRELLIERLVGRLQWERLFEKSVEWVFLKDAEIDRFIQTQALWCEQEDDGLSGTTMGTNTAPPASSSQIHCYGQGLVEQKIDILIQLEHDISEFDDNSFMGVWNAYQGMVNLFGQVSGFLKQRQTGFEAAFDDLSKRCDLARQAMEQQLIMMDIIAQFKDIKSEGDALRQMLLVENDTINGTFRSSMMAVNSSSNNNNNDCNLNSNGGGSGGGICGYGTADPDNNTIDLCVEKYKKKYAGFIAQARARIPELKAPVMSTAMGALDFQYTETTNDAIRKSLYSYGLSLSLILDGLDQLLAVRQHIRSLQQRAKLVCQQMERFTNWMNERRRVIEKSDFSIFDNKTGEYTNLADFTSQSMHQNKNELLIHLEKELGIITYRMQQMEGDDLAKLLNTVKVLQSEMNGANTVSSCQRIVMDTLECLEAAQLNIKTALQERGSKLDALKRYLAWKSQWIKSHQWIISTTRKLLEFCIKKARWHPSVSDNSSKSSGARQHDLESALHSHQDRITGVGGNYMAALTDSYTSMVDGIGTWEKILLAKDGTQTSDAIGNGVQHPEPSQFVPDFSARQSIMVKNYHTLQDLSQYAATLVTQRPVISNILTELDNASREGEKLRDILTKSTLQVVKTERHSAENSQQRRQSPKEKVELFRQLVDKIKSTSTNLEYPRFAPNLSNGEYDSTNLSAQVQQLQQTDIKALVARKVVELENLDGRITELLKLVDKMEKKKQLVDQYNDDVLKLTRWIQDQTMVLENRRLNVAAEAMDDLLNGTSWIDLDKQHQHFVSMVGSFETDRLKSMHDKVVLLVEDVATQSGQQLGGSLDVTVAVTQNLGAAINNFTALQQKVADEAVIIDAVGKRIEWIKVLQDAHRQLEGLQVKLAVWHKKLNQWINDSVLDASNDWQEDTHAPLLTALYQDMEHMMTDGDHFTKSTMTKVHLFYDTFVQCFTKLPRPMAVPDHIEDTMATLDGLNTRCQETVASKNKELCITHSHLQWNYDCKTVYLAFTNYLDRLTSFVTHTARWRPRSSKTEHEISDNQQFSLDDGSHIHQQCTDLTQQLRVIESRLDVLHDDATTNDVSNSIIQHSVSQRDQLGRLTRYVPQLACFMNLVISQNKMVEGLLSRMSQATIGLTSLLAGNTFDLSGSNDTHTSIDQLIKQVEQVRLDTAKMIYPVRPTMNYSNTTGCSERTDNDQSYWVALDHTDNHVIQNILTATLMKLEHRLTEIDRTIHASKQQSQQPQQSAKVIHLKQRRRPENITVVTRKTQRVEEITIPGSQKDTIGRLTKSLSLNNCSRSSLPTHVPKALSQQSTTKIMPGQVGKYWIGNTEPRLIYCRVLKSNVVMARVGGGWMELSQFLLDHGCNDGSAILDTFVSSENTSSVDSVDHLVIFGYENKVAKSGSSTSLTLSRSSGKLSTSYLQTMAGYTDGYQYVRIDEWGNHLALNMVRVDDHYFIS